MAVTELAQLVDGNRDAVGGRGRIRSRARARARAKKVALGVWLVVIAGFVLTPLFAIIGTSFSNRSYWEFPPSHFGTRAWQRLWANSDITASLATSVVCAALCGVVSSALAMLIAFALVRNRRGVNRTISTVLLLPLMIPHIALGAALYQVFIDLQIPFQLSTIVLAQMVIALPFAVRAMMVAIAGLDLNAERAAYNLGAGPLRTAAWVVLPALRPGLAVAFVLAFVASFDDAAIALFVNSPTATTLPVRLLNYVDEESGPFIAAAGTLLLGCGLVIVIVIGRCIGLSRAFGIERRE